MPKDYDVTTKRLIDAHPQDWLRFLGVSAADDVVPLEVVLVDTDLGTITAASDRVLKILEPVEMLYHIEMESGHHGKDKPLDLLNYSVLLSRKYGLPVQTTVILLRKEADSPALTGALEFRRADGSIYLRFEYNIVRVWQIPVEELLTGGLGTLPLAPLANVRRNELPDVVRRMQRRFDEEAGPEQAELWTATKILLGLRYPRAFADSLLKGVRQMRESVTYQAILEEGEAKGRAEGRVEGRVEGDRQILLDLGTRRLGPVPTDIAAHIAIIDSPALLTDLIERVFAVENWSELLQS